MTSHNFIEQAKAYSTAFLAHITRQPGVDIDLSLLKLPAHEEWTSCNVILEDLRRFPKIMQLAGDFQEVLSWVRSAFATEHLFDRGMFLRTALRMYEVTPELITVTQSNFEDLSRLRESKDYQERIIGTLQWSAWEIYYCLQSLNSLMGSRGVYFVTDCISGSRRRLDDINKIINESFAEIAESVIPGEGQILKEAGTGDALIYTCEFIHAIDKIGDFKLPQGLRLQCTDQFNPAVIPLEGYKKCKVAGALRPFALWAAVSSEKNYELFYSLVESLSGNIKSHAVYLYTSKDFRGNKRLSYFNNHTEKTSFLSYMEDYKDTLTNDCTISLRLTSPQDGVSIRLTRQKDIKISAKSTKSLGKFEEIFQAYGIDHTPGLRYISSGNHVHIKYSDNNRTVSNMFREFGMDKETFRWK